jgi:hypothetical protein
VPKVIGKKLRLAQIGFRKIMPFSPLAMLRRYRPPPTSAVRTSFANGSTTGPRSSAHVLRQGTQQLNLSRFYAISQIEYCRNFIFNRHFPIHKLFECCCEVGLWRLTADKLAEIFGTRVHRRMQGELAHRHRLHRYHVRRPLEGSVSHRGSRLRLLG